MYVHYDIFSYGRIIALQIVIFNLLSVCGLNCHHKCEKKVSNLCGVNQKLLAEALESIRPNRQKPSTPASKSKTADGKTEVSVNYVCLATCYTSTNNLCLKGKLSNL